MTAAYIKREQLSIKYKLVALTKEYTHSFLTSEWGATLIKFIGTRNKYSISDFDFTFETVVTHHLNLAATMCRFTLLCCGPILP